MVRLFSLFVTIILVSSVIPAVYQAHSAPVSPFVMSPLHGSPNQFNPSTTYQSIKVYTATVSSSLPSVVMTDWAISSVGLTPPTPQAGDSVTLSAVLVALSSTGSFPQSVDLECTIDGVSCGGGSVSYRGPIGVPVTVTAQTPWTAWPGTHTLIWSASTNNDPNPSNNIMSTAFTVGTATQTTTSCTFTSALSPSTITQGTSSVMVSGTDTCDPPGTSIGSLIYSSPCPSSGLPSGVAFINPGNLTDSSTDSSGHFSYSANTATLSPGSYCLIIQTPSISGQSGGYDHLTVTAATTSSSTLIAATTSTPTLTVKGQPASGGEWTSIGPSPIQGCGTSPSNNYCSGRVSAIALDPSHPGTIYIGGAVGGVWKSTNGGSTWTPLTDNQPSLAIGSIAVDPSGVVYVGTGDGTERCDNYYGAGVLKSTDGGSTWTQLGASTFGRATIPKILVDPSSPNIVIASSSSGHTASATGCGIPVDPGVPLGIYVSQNSGLDWTRTLTATVKADDMVLAPNSPSTVFAAVDASLYESTDSGQHWSGPLGGGLPTLANVQYTRIKLAASSNSTFPLVLYALTYQLYNQQDQPIDRGALYVSTNDGSTWTQVSTPTGFCSGCAGRMALAVDPTNPDIIYLGGPYFYRTTDGGNHWTTFATGYGNVFHEDMQAFAFSPTSHSTLYVGSDGGIWVSTNADSCTVPPDYDKSSFCWTDLNLGLDLAQFNSIATNPTIPNNYIGGTQDNGFSQYLGTSTIWQMKGTLYNGESTFDYGDNGWTAFDPTNPSTMYAVSPNGGFLRSDDGGAHWNQGTDPTGNHSEPSEFEEPVAMDPSTPSTQYFGTYRLWKTTNKGDTWFLPGPGLSVSAPNLLSAIAVAPSNGQWVYAGTSAGTFFASEDGGSNFVEADTGLPNRFMTGIAVDPTNPQQVYVTFSGFGGMHIFETTNGGTFWSDITSNLPDLPTDTILLDPINSTIYVGTDSAVFKSTNGGTSWVVVGTGLPNVPVFGLAFGFDGPLLAATYGRGVWTLGTTPSASQCLIATASFGSSAASEVQLLRNFRDNSILNTRAGTSFMIAFNAWYYSFSPTTASYLRTHSVERTLTRTALYPLIGIMFISSTAFNALRSSPEVAVVISGLMASSLLGAFYVGLPLGVLTATVKRLRDERRLKLLQYALTVALLIGFGMLIIGELFNLVPLLIMSTSTLVLSTISLSAISTSKTVARIKRYLS